MKSPLLGQCLWQKGYLTGWKRQKVIRYQNQSGLLQCSIRHTRINPGLCLSLQGGSKSTPRARIAVRPKLARSCWFDTTIGKSLRKIGTETGWAAQGSLLLAIPQQGVPLAGASSRVPDTHGWTLGMHAPVGLALKSHWPWSRRNVPSWGCQNVMCQFEVLWVGVEGPCLHRPGNWLVRLLIDLWAKAGIRSRIY
jgi:hypothetical protein